MRCLQNNGKNTTDNRRRKMAQMKKSAAGKKTLADSVKVNKATINQIKADGMKKAVAKAASGKASTPYMVGTSRMYGSSRVNAARPTSKPTPRSTSGASKNPDLIQKITNAYRVTAAEAKQIVKVISESKPVMTGFNPINETAKFLGGSVKANVELPGTIAKMAARTAKNAAKNFKSGFNKK